jgi:hypothetical protein
MIAISVLSVRPLNALMKQGSAARGRLVARLRESALQTEATKNPAAAGLSWERIRRPATVASDDHRGVSFVEAELARLARDFLRR